MKQEKVRVEHRLLSTKKIQYKDSYNLRLECLGEHAFVEGIPLYALGMPF